MTHKYRQKREMLIAWKYWPHRGICIYADRRTVTEADKRSIHELHNRNEQREAPIRATLGWLACSCSTNGIIWVQQLMSTAQCATGSDSWTIFANSWECSSLITNLEAGSRPVHAFREVSVNAPLCAAALSQPILRHNQCLVHSHFTPVALSLIAQAYLEGVSNS